MFEGLYPYEKVLMVLGIILFAILAAMLVAYVFQKRGLTSLFPFFLMPVVMIGFPAFQKISYEKGKLVLEKYTQEVTESGGDEKARAQLRASIKRIAPRVTSDPDANLMVARAYKALGQRERALERVDAVLKANPQLPQGLRLREELQRPVLGPAQPR